MLSFFKQEEEFQELYRTHFHRVRRVLSGMTGSNAVAEELTQEAFLKAWSSLSGFGFRSTLKTWVYTVAINVGRDWLRSHKNIKMSELFEEGSLESLSPESRAVQESLLETDEESREILVLTYYEGMTSQEISKVLKIPEGTVKSRLHYAKSKLQPLLVSKGFDV